MHKVCIISAGMIANSAHIPAYKFFSEDFEIVAVCDTVEETARSTAERHGIKNFYTDADTMLERHKPDVVSICVPNFLHKKMTMLALSYGAHVICEKPVAFTYADAIEMYNYADAQGRLLMACQSMRFMPDRLAAKEMIEKGMLGEIYYGEFSRVRRRGIPRWGTFHMSKYSGGGAFVDLGVHMVDSLIWLMGNPKLKAVSATMRVCHADEEGSLKNSGARAGKVHTMREFKLSEMDVEDFSCGSLLFENDLRVNFTVAWAANLPESSDIKLIGKKKGIFIPDGSLLSGEDTYDILSTAPDIYGQNTFPGHFHVIDNLRGVLSGTAEPVVKPEETINTAMIIENVYKSAREGREICIDD